jgi:hypothetical protein
MEKAFTQSGATVLTFTLPDLPPARPLARFVTPRVLARNRAMRAWGGGSADSGGSVSATGDIVRPVDVPTS